MGLDILQVLHCNLCRWLLWLKQFEGYLGWEMVQEHVPAAAAAAECCEYVVSFNVYFEESVR